MTVERGRPWERPATGPGEATVAGGDAALAAWVAANPGGRVSFVPHGSDLARALGIAEGGSGGRGAEGGEGHDLVLDAMHVEAGGRAGTAVNLVVVGTPPDRLGALARRRDCSVVVDGRTVHQGAATSVVVASGQFLRGLDVVPRGHPGDGRLEVQVYRPRRGAEAGQMRRRLATGGHVPHPRILQVSGRAVEIRAGRRAVPLEVDGRPWPAVTAVTVELVPGAFTVVV